MMYAGAGVSKEGNIDDDGEINNDANSQLFCPHCFCSAYNSSLCDCFVNNNNYQSSESSSGGGNNKGDTKDSNTNDVPMHKVRHSIYSMHAIPCDSGTDSGKPLSLCPQVSTTKVNLPEHDPPNPNNNLGVQ